MTLREKQIEHTKHLTERSRELVNKWKGISNARDELADDLDILIKDIRNFAAYIPDDALDESLVSLAKSLEEINKSF